MRVEGVEALTIWYFWAFALMGQALKAIVFIVPACLCGGRRPGFAPAGDLLSCARQERRRRYAPHSLRPLRAAKGQTCVGVLAGCAVELTARLRRSVRTTTASQWTKRVCPSAHPPPRKHPDAGAARRGGDESGHRCARPWVRGRKRHALASQAKRSDGPCGMLDSYPFCMRLRRAGDGGSGLAIV